MGCGRTLYVVFVWHFHQPWYYDPDEKFLVLPWVRMHCVGNYYKMAYILQRRPEIKVTFTFSSSLLMQILDYVKGMKDYAEIISRKLVDGEELDYDERFAMVRIPGGFFDINWRRIVDVVPRYRELRDKALKVMEGCIELPEYKYIKCVADAFTHRDLVDLATLFNLFWMNPSVLRDEFPELYDAKKRAYVGMEKHFTEDLLAKVLDAHRSIIQRVPNISKSSCREAYRDRSCTLQSPFSTYTNSFRMD